MPAGAMPAFAITTSMAPKRSTAPSTARSSACPVGHVALERGGVGAALRRHARELVRLQSDHGHVRSRRRDTAGGLRPIPRAAPVTNTVRPRNSQVIDEP